MVAHKRTGVKEPCTSCGSVHANFREELMCWMDTHPRVGWFWAAVLLLNTLLNILDLTGFGK